MEVIDLDVLRPEPKIIKLGGKEIDVSFVPCGITFDLDPLIQELVSLTPAKIKANPTTMRKAFDAGIKVCALFCAKKHPEFDEKWFLANTSPEQIKVFVNAIQQALHDSYAGVSAHAKN